MKRLLILVEGQTEQAFVKIVLAPHLVQSVGDPRFIPNLVVHEFEALLFSAPEQIAAVLRVPNRVDQLRAITSGGSSPEEINDSPQTAPSKRLEQVYPGYHKEKRRLGPLIAQKIGLSAIRDRCKHFAGWLSRLENL